MKNVRLLFTALLVALLLILLAACTREGEPSASPAPSEVAAATAVPSPEPEAPTPEPTVEPTPIPEMSVTSAGIVDGALGDEYGKYGNQQKNGVPTLSPPLSVLNAPEGTACFAIVMLDPDSKPLCGYEWIHWLAANVAAPELAENASLELASSMMQGENDFGKMGYGGPTPPDKPHTYVITVYALDAHLDLKDGFTKAGLEAAMAGHVLAEATVTAVYRN